MKPEKIMCDETEIVVVDETSDRRVMRRIVKNDIQNIKILTCKETHFFKEVDSECIEILLHGMSSDQDGAGPITYYMSKNKDRWESYKAQLRKYCKDNRVTLIDETV